MTIATMNHILRCMVTPATPPTRLPGRSRSCSVPPRLHTQRPGRCALYDDLADDGLSSAAIHEVRRKCSSVQAVTPQL